MTCHVKSGREAERQLTEEKVRDREEEGQSQRGKERWDYE